MIRYVVSRVGEAVVVLFIGSIFCFVFIRLLPGSPAQALYGGQLQKLTRHEQMRIEENLGLNEPLYSQYVKWFVNVLQGKWGHSYSTGEEVIVVISQAIQPTFVLMLAAAILTFVLSLLLGVMTGLKRYSLFDHVVTVSSFIFMSLPSFWFALMLMLFLSVYLGVLPTSGMGHGGCR